MVRFSNAKVNKLLYETHSTWARFKINMPEKYTHGMLVLVKLWNMY